MNTLPTEIKSLITDFLFSKSESYNQRLPLKASEEAKKDLNDLNALRVLCDGGPSFLDGRFKSSSIQKTKDYTIKWFEMPKLKTLRLCYTRFIERSIEYFSVESFCKHDACLTELSSRITALRLKQRVLLQRVKRVADR